MSDKDWTCFRCGGSAFRRYRTGAVVVVDARDDDLWICGSCAGFLYAAQHQFIMPRTRHRQEPKPWWKLW